MPLIFMKEFYGLSFAEAVKELLGEEGVGDTNRRTAKEDAGRQKVCPISLLDWNCQKEMKAVRLQGSISLSRGTIGMADRSDDARGYL